MAIYETDFDHRLKADDSPVTEADIQADQIIFDGLTKAFPNIPIVSEERQQDLSNDTKEFFLVDPLDGTKEFLKRNGEFTVNIALIQAGISVAGVVGAPAQGLMYLAGQGIGAFRRDGCGDIRLKVKPRRSGEPIRVVGSRSHTGAEMQSWLAALNEPFEFTPAGSSLKFCRIAEGLADVYPRLGSTCQWDTAAGQCILENAGGSVVTLQSNPVLYILDRSRLNDFFVAYGSSDAVITVKSIEAVAMY
ncbi:MAG: 3(2),5-bisphosphate nucleotidase CysQ [Pseudomonadota bacterium]